jgi:hypothetical protein
MVVVVVDSTPSDPTGAELRPAGALRSDGVHVFPDRIQQLLDVWLWDSLRDDYRSARTALPTPSTSATSASTTG